MSLPEPDRRGLEAFLVRWSGASPLEKLKLVAGKLALLLAFLGVILLSRWMIGG